MVGETAALALGDRPPPLPMGGLAKMVARVISCVESGVALAVPAAAADTDKL